MASIDELMSKLRGDFDQSESGKKLAEQAGKLNAKFEKLEAESNELNKQKRTIKRSLDKLETERVSKQNDYIVEHLAEHVQSDSSHAYPQQQDNR